MHLGAVLMGGRMWVTLVADSGLVDVIEGHVGSAVGLLAVAV